MNSTSLGAALITGSAKRVGRALALSLADAGYDIALHCNRSSAEAELLAKEISARGRKASVFVLDLMKTSRLELLMNDVVAAFPYLNVLINNASVFERSAFLDTSIAEFEKNFSLHLAAPFFLTQAFAKQVSSGHVINIIDTHVTRNKTPFFPYLLSKKTLRDFTLMAAAELAPRIKVNGVCPGIMLPSGDGFDEEYLKKKPSSLPMQKVATVEELSDAVLMLLRGHVTGQLMYVDGGEHLV